VILKRATAPYPTVNHRIAKSIVHAHPHTLIGLEELTGIRERTKRRKRRRKQHGKGTAPVSPKARRANRHASKWAFAELHGMIAYKTALSGSSLAIKVDPHYTSQTCPMCGYTSKQNRSKKGLLFLCQNGQCPHRQRTGGQPYTLHADLVGARNIAMRTLLIRQDWISTGVLSVRPDVSDAETKAARLTRYAELRWSSDTSPS
jgi:putative transposase